jgi:hypothetical protein
MHVAKMMAFFSLTVEFIRVIGYHAEAEEHYRPPNNKATNAILYIIIYCPS